MKYGKLVRIPKIEDAEKCVKAAVDLGFNTCQLVYKPEKYDLSDAKIIADACKKYDMEISAMFCGPHDTDTVWDIYWGYLTAGVNVEAYRFSRVQYIKEATTFANELGIEDIIIHAGFVPNNPFAPEYAVMCTSVYTLATHCKKYNMNLLFETGGESPITLLRLIEDVGTGNLYINLDPANILVYGYGNPVDAIDVFGKYVRNIHGKDGCVPTNPREVGKETPIGKGMVDFRTMLKKLHDIGYDRYITIEREGGDSIDDDVVSGRKYLEDIWNSF